MDNKYRRTPAEVAADASVEHTGKGVFNELKGTVKNAWGRVTGRPSTRLAGKVDELKGRAQQGLGRMEAKEANMEAGDPLGKSRREP